MCGIDGLAVGRCVLRADDDGCGAGAGSGAATRAHAGHRSARRSDPVNKDNVRTYAWCGAGRRVDPQFSSRDPKLRVPNSFRATPLMIGGVLYSPNGIGLVEAFDPGSGKTLWVQRVSSGFAGPERRQHARSRVLARAATTSRLFVQRRRHVLVAALNAKTGRPCADFRPVWNRRPELRSAAED